MTGALIYSDDLNVALELVSLSTRLGKSASVAIVGYGNVSEATKKLSVSGVSEIYEVANDAFKDLFTDTVVDALSTIYPMANPELILIGSTRRGKDTAARLAARLKIGCISDALGLRLDAGNLVCERMVWGGNSIATVISTSASVITIPPRAYERASGDSSPHIVSVDFQPKPRRITLVEKKAKQKGQMSLKDAEVIVSVGRGLRKKEDLALVEALANVLNGVLGASRPLTSDLGWLPEERQVGLTGSTVKPKLYVAVGISGQIQHITGMRDSKLVAAINSDKTAPIFEECDYGIVGDLYVVVPQLVNELKAKLS